MSGDGVRLTLVRNATLRLELAGRTLLVDPCLAPKDSMDPFAGGARNPTVDLPMPAADVVAGIDAVFVSHLHPDHWDAAAAEVLPRDVPVLAPAEVAAGLGEQGFTRVTVLEAGHDWHGVRLVRTDGRHGHGAIAEAMGRVSGLVLVPPDGPGVYWAGDTVWCDAVERAIAEHAPGVIVTHSGGATLPGHEDDPIIMDVPETLRTCAAAPEATIVAVHLEALDHCPVTRAGLRRAAEAAGVGGLRLRIPADGETVLLGTG